MKQKIIREEISEIDENTREILDDIIASFKEIFKEDGIELLRREIGEELVINGVNSGANMKYVVTHLVKSGVGVH